MNVLSDEQIAEIRKRHAKWTREWATLSKTFSDVAIPWWKDEVAIDAHDDRAALLAHIAATSAQGSAGDAWRTIDSAPKDGTRVLLCILDFVFVGRWGTVPVQLGDVTGWVVYESEDPWYSWVEETATHWMPLPSPPAGPTPTPSPTQENEG